MNINELIEEVGKRTLYSRYMTGNIINETFVAIAAALKRGEKVTIPGFGCFSVKSRAPRTGRNPHTNQPVPIPAKHVASFKPFEKLKRLVEYQK